MMFSRIVVLNTLSTYDIFSLQWVCGDVTPSQMEEHLYIVPQEATFLRPATDFSDGKMIFMLVEETLTATLESHFYALL